MDLRVKILAEKFRNISYFSDLHEYIKERTKDGSLNYEKLKYLYDNLYKNCSQFIMQNIYPVGEFLSKGYSFEETEKIANTLKDASNAAFFYDKNDTGKLYNKYFTELRFSYFTYNEFVIQGNPRDVAFEKMQYENEITQAFQRDLECHIIDGMYLYSSDKEMYLSEIQEEKNKLKDEFKDLINNDPNFNDKNTNNYSNIVFSSNIVRGIDGKNLCPYFNYNSRDLEKYPFNTQELLTIDKYIRLNKTSEIFENYIMRTYEKSLEDEQEVE